MTLTPISTETGFTSLAIALSGCEKLAFSGRRVVDPASMAYLKAGGSLVIASTQHGKHAKCHGPSGEGLDERVFFHNQALIGPSP